MQQTEFKILVILVTVVVTVFILGSVFYLILFRRRRIENIREKEIINQQHTQELLTTQLEIQTQTMQHIGREIHDSVGQKLTLASLYTQQLAYENKAPQVTGKIENISSIINESLQELRQLSKSLTDDAIATKTITELLEDECIKVNDLQKCNVLYELPQNPAALSYQAKNIVLRVVQEFMQNSIKHSGCKTIKVSMQQTDTRFILLLTDDGSGFTPAEDKPGGIGLTNMEKRISMLHGTYSLTSNPAGTTLTSSIPL